MQDNADGSDAPAQEELAAGRAGEAATSGGGVEGQDRGKQKRQQARDERKRRAELELLMMDEGALQDTARLISGLSPFSASESRQQRECA